MDNLQFDAGSLYQPSLLTGYTAISITSAGTAGAGVVFMNEEQLIHSVHRIKFGDDYYKDEAIALERLAVITALKVAPQNRVGSIASLSRVVANDFDDFFHGRVEDLRGVSDNNKDIAQKVMAAQTKLGGFAHAKRQQSLASTLAHDLAVSARRQGQSGLQSYVVESKTLLDQVEELETFFRQRFYETSRSMSGEPIETEWSTREETRAAGADQDAAP